MNNDDKDVRLALWQVYAAYNEHALRVRLGKSTDQFLAKKNWSYSKLISRAVQAANDYAYFRISQHNHNRRIHGKVIEFLTPIPEFSLYLKFTVSDVVTLNSYHPVERGADATWTKRKD